MADDLMAAFYTLVLAAVFARVCTESTAMTVVMSQGA